MKRPMAYSGAAFFLTLLMVNILGVNFGISMGILFFTVSVVVGFLPSLKQGRMWAIPIFCAFLASAVFCLGINIFVRPVEKELAGKTLNVNATVIDLPTQGEFPVYTVKSDIVFSDGKTHSVKYRFYSTERIECEPYDTLNCNIEFSKINDDYADSNYAKNIFINAKLVSEIKVIPTLDKPIMYHILKVREHLINVVRKTFDEQSAGLICGVMTGDKSFMPFDLKENIRISGLSHITAVSGIHISILATSLMLILQKMKIRKRYSYFLVIVPVWLFVLIVGTPYSTVRSAFMFTLMALGAGIFQRNDSFSSLFGALMICGLISPFSALDVGLLSSASATFGLLFFTKYVNKWMLNKVPSKIRNKKSMKYVVSSFAQTISAVAGILPCMFLFYKNFSLVVLLSNLTVLPLVTVLLFCSIFGGLLSFAPVVSNPLLFVSGIVSKIIIFLCNTFSKIPFAEISIAREYLLLAFCGVVLLFGIAIVFFTLQKSGRRLISILLVCSLLCFAVSAGSFHIINRNKAEIYVPDDGDGIYVLVVYKGETSLICGNLEYSSPSEIQKALKSLGIGKIDYLITQEEDSRKVLETLSNKVKIKNYFIHKELEKTFPIVATKGGKVSFVTDSLTTKKGVRVDLIRNRSEILITVDDFTALMLNRNLDSETPTYDGANVVICGRSSLEKLKNLKFYKAVCSCDYIDKDTVLDFFAKNNIDGVYTAGYGGIRVWASNGGGFTLSRTE